MASPTRGSAPWTPDGVPPLSLALRGGSPLYQSRRTVNSADFSAAEAALGTDKIGVWGLRPQRGPGAEPLAFSLPYLTYLSAYGALPWTRWGRRPQTPIFWSPRPTSTLSLPRRLGR